MPCCNKRLDLVDHHTAANYTELRVTHMDFDLRPDFPTKKIHGKTTYSILCEAARVGTVSFDTDFKMSISSVKVVSQSFPAATNQSLDMDDNTIFAFGSICKASDVVKTTGAFSGGDLAELSFEHTRASFGGCLKIHLCEPLEKNQLLILAIDFVTSPEASAIQWLSKEQTADKKGEFVFTQAEAIHARSMFPCFDLPRNKATYSARLQVPATFTGLMSAVQISAAAITKAAKSQHLFQDADGLVSYYYHQAVPIPSYLSCLVVGQLESRELSDRCRVWAEPSIVDASAYEFVDTEKYLQAGEKICGPYVWGRYDLLVLPPSFPFGGMENPCLTFVTPTLLAGDRSLANVVAHEIAHSWTGNLVTNASWECFWLNEGWTVYIERAILELMDEQTATKKEDVRTAEKDFTPFQLDQFRATAGYHVLKDAIETLGATNPLGALVPKLENVDPDDAFSSIPYEKGFFFLRYLESLAGKHAFRDYVKAYLTHFAYKAVSVDMWREFFTAHFKNDPSIMGQIDWDNWMNAPGLPDYAPTYDKTILNAIKAASHYWEAVRTAGKSESKAKAGQHGHVDLAAWTPLMVVLFLTLLYEGCEQEAKQDVISQNLDEMDEQYGFSLSKNSEIAFMWLMLQIRVTKTNHSEAIVEMVTRKACKFVSQIGRMKFARPIYRSLARSGNETMHTAAVSTFKEHRSFYHPICAQLIEKDITL